MIKSQIRTIMIYNCPLKDLNKKISEIMKVLRLYEVKQVTLTIEHSNKGFNILVFLSEEELKAKEIAQLYKAISKGEIISEFYITRQNMPGKGKQKSNN